LSSVAVAIPTSVEDLIQSRIDRLNEPTRLTLKVAAVLGTEVSFAALLGSYPVPIEPAILREHLSTLDRLGLLLVGTASLPTYRFKNSVTQLVAYHSLLEAQRRDLHGRAANYFEEALSDVPGGAMDVLAYHYAHSDQQVKAAYYLRLAGEQATRQAAYTAAIDYFNQALERVGEKDYATRCAILEGREQIHRAQGNLAARRKDLEALKATAEAWDDPHWRARADFRRAVFAQDQGDYRTADAHLQEVISQAAALSDEGMMGLALMERGNILVGWSRYADALICYEVAAELFDQQKNIVASERKCSVTPATGWVPWSRTKRQNTYRKLLAIGQVWRCSVWTRRFCMWNSACLKKQNGISSQLGSGRRR